MRVVTHSTARYQLMAHNTGGFAKRACACRGIQHCSMSTTLEGSADGCMGVL